MSFWDVVWFIVISFAFVAYLMVMFSIIADLFRDREESGVMKAVWIVCLIFFPLITALVYLIARGSGMADRQMQTAANMKEQQDAYIRDVAAKASPADQIAQAQKMLNDGAISQPEFERLKEKALA
ncbi:SHOCT domain-containing protein [Nocardioides ungokensis]|jgi:predicted PurR-regulated permease PerM